MYYLLYFKAYFFPLPAYYAKYVVLRVLPSDWIVQIKIKQTLRTWVVHVRLWNQILGYSKFVWIMEC